MLTHREFRGDSDKVKSGETWYFNQKGHATVEKEDFDIGGGFTKEIEVDVSGNWEHYPAFGDYRSVARKER
jgi:hypothetical protein